MLPKENRLFDSDSFEIAIARSVFVRWMRKHGKWAKYMRYMQKMSTSERDFEREYYTSSWVQPDAIVSFLGRCSFDYNNAYLPWKEICKRYLEDMIREVIDEFVF